MNLRQSKALAVGLLAILTVCSSRPVYGAAASDPCSLLTPAQVSAVLGVTVGAGKPVATKLCDWTTPGQPAGSTAKKVTVTLQDARAFAYAQMPVGHGVTKTSVSGIGDDAVYGTTPGYATVLTVKKGDVVFVVHVWGFDQNKDIDLIKEKEKTLALEILSKL